MTTTCTALITVECIDQPAELLQVKDMEISPSDDAIKEATFKFLEGSDLVFMTRKELKIQVVNICESGSSHIDFWFSLKIFTDGT